MEHPLLHYQKMLHEKAGQKTDTNRSYSGRRKDYNSDRTVATDKKKSRQQSRVELQNAVYERVVQTPFSSSPRVEEEDTAVISERRHQLHPQSTRRAQAWATERQFQKSRFWKTYFHHRRPEPFTRIHNRRQHPQMESWIDNDKGEESSLSRRYSSCCENTTGMKYCQSTR